MNDSQRTDRQFAEVVDLIASARQRAFQAVNTALIDLYWQVGAIISRKLEAAEWGDGVVTQLAQYLAHTQPGLRGFTSRNLFRMRRFYEAYRDHEIVTAAPSLLPAEDDDTSGWPLVTAVPSPLKAPTGDGKDYTMCSYNLDAIIAVGFRVNSTRATQFRQWATSVLRDFAIRGRTNSSFPRHFPSFPRRRESVRP